MESSKAAARVGRPRSFDEGAALEKAMVVFWEKGYNGSSVSDLISAMGITPPSLYAAFGNKEGLFLRAIEHYCAGPAGYVLKALEATTAKGVAEQRLLGTVRQITGGSCPAGCMVTQTAARYGADSCRIGEAVTAIHAKMQQAYVDRFKRAQAEGDLSNEADPLALSRYIDAVGHGLTMQATLGVEREGLEKLVEIALQQWPA